MALRQTQPQIEMSTKDIFRGGKKAGVDCLEIWKASGTLGALQGLPYLYLASHNGKQALT
jgi:hypothetical protein